VGEFLGGFDVGAGAKGIISNYAEGEGGDAVQDITAPILLKSVYLVHKIVVCNFGLS